MSSYNNQIRQKVIQAIRSIPEDSVWGIGLKQFADDQENKSDDDFLTVIEQIKQQIEAERNSMLNILGEKAFTFFYTLKVDYTAWDFKATDTEEEEYFNECLNCSSIWSPGTDEYELQQCSACGWVAGSPTDEDLEDDELEYEQIS